MHSLMMKYLVICGILLKNNCVAFFTTDYRKIKSFEPCEIFLSGLEKNLSQASKIFFLCRNGEIILIPTCSILLGNPLHNNPPPHQSYSLMVAAGAKTVMVAPRPQRWTYWWTWPWWMGRGGSLVAILSSSSPASPQQ